MNCAREGTRKMLMRDWTLAFRFCRAYTLRFSVYGLEVENKVSEALYQLNRCIPRFQLLRSALEVLREPESGGEREGCFSKCVSSSCWGGFL